MWLSARGDIQYRSDGPILATKAQKGMIITMEIGAQFFTLRDSCKTLEGLSESLKKVADIGYKNVQISGVCAYEPTWLAEQLKVNGLRCVITHYNNDKIIKEPQQTVKDHQVFGCRYIGIGCMPGGLEHPEDYDNFVSAFKPSAKKIHELGCLLMYHNHQFEFMKDSSGKPQKWRTR